MSETLKAWLVAASEPTIVIIDAIAFVLIVVGIVFVLLQVAPPIHQAVSANLGSRLAAWLNDRLAEACVRPPGVGHLEDPKLTGDLTVAREFDLGMTGPDHLGRAPLVEHPDAGVGHRVRDVVDEQDVAQDAREQAAEHHAERSDTP